MPTFPPEEQGPRHGGVDSSRVTRSAVWQAAASARYGVCSWDAGRTRESSHATPSSLSLDSPPPSRTHRGYYGRPSGSPGPAALGFRARCRRMGAGPQEQAPLPFPSPVMWDELGSGQGERGSTVCLPVAASDSASGGTGDSGGGEGRGNWGVGGSCKAMESVRTCRYTPLANGAMGWMGWANPGNSVG